MPVSTSIVSRISAFIKLFRIAVAGTEKEFTTGSINRAIFLLSIPMILEMAMESLFAVVDIFFVSHLGINAITTVGLTESVLTLVYTCSMGLSMAATAVVARRTGEKNPDEAAHAAVQAIYIALAITVVIGIAGILFAKNILAVMGASQEVIAYGHVYTKILIGGNVVIVLLFLINGIFRGAGDAALAMRSLWIANGLNIILCPLLITGPGPLPALGLKGAALATFIGRGAGVAYQLYHLFGGKNLIRIARRHLLPDGKVMAAILKIAAGGTAQMLIASASWIFLVRIISHFGKDAVAGYTIAIRVVIFTILPAWGMANAAAALVGQNLGAQQPDRAERSVWRAAFLNMIFLGIVAIVFLTAAPVIIRLFTEEPVVVNYGVQCLRLMSLGYVFYAYGMVITQAFNGAGDTKTPTLINLFSLWMWQMPLAWILAIWFNAGPQGVFWAIAISESTVAVVGIFLFRRGTWKHIKI
ncbi:MATE family efflux transporter [Chitinophaga solisilvae]|uniref:Multidrug-efflux transporter n=1 Tax=Chitinophaga solisilvae TaxID=1233460 RepID=A0A433WKI0_9BACT|nr:MATE family efflux transporter [Chitinophaga solisilvae]NSL89202.1 MATE family efflux transporter [Chitinophaga solisilvae]